MKSLRYGFLILLLGLATISQAQGPGHDAGLIVSPREVQLAPGQGQRFEAAAFSASGAPLRIAAIQWRVDPDSLGKITEDGFFMAGLQPGKGRIVAVAEIAGMNLRLEGEAIVAIGRHDPPRIQIIVRPNEAVVPPGGTQSFHAAAVNAQGEPITIENVRWQVRPNHLGTIDERGNFTAGREIGAGAVIAFVQTAAGSFHGEARVLVAPPANSAIEGRVTDEVTGEPITHGVVWAEHVGNIRWRREARIDSTGNYFIDRLIAGIYVVKAHARGYLAEFYDNAEHYTDATPVQVVKDDTVSGIDFALGVGATIRGTITAEVDSQPLAGAHVVAIDVLRRHEKEHAVTAEDGSYAIEGLRSGSYAVLAEAEGYKEEFYDNASNLVEAKLIAVTAPEVVEGIDLALATGSAIAGKVVDAVTNEPIAKAVVTIHSLISASIRPHLVREVRTDENGEYVASVRPGFYVVAADARGYHKEFYDGVSDFLLATPVQVFENQHTTGIDFSLDPLSSISGKVMDQVTGEPIVGAVVTAFPERPGRDALIDPAELRAPHAARTDSLGEYTIQNLRSGKYFVLAEARTYLTEFWQESETLAGATPVEVPESGNVTGIDFTLQHGGAISGTVIAANDGTPVPGASVKVWELNGKDAGHAETDEHGQYVVGGLRTGDYLVFVQARGFKPVFYDSAETREDATPVHVEAPNETAGIDFKLTKPESRRGSLSGTVVSDVDGNPIPLAVVVAVPLQPGPARFTVTDRLGFYRFEGLKPDNYGVIAWAIGYLSEFYDNASSWDTATPVAVEAGHETTGIDFALAPVQRGAYTISGRITRGRSGNGAANAMVFALENGSRVASAMSDANGNFSINEVPAGEYKLMATGQSGSAYYGGANETNATSVAVGNGSNSASIEMSLPDTPTGVSETANVPVSFALEQNYPNPFNPETTIRYHLPKHTEVSLVVHNALGQRVRTLANGSQEAGVYRVVWDGRDDHGVQLASGIYFFRLVASDFSMTRKMVYVR